MMADTSQPDQSPEELLELLRSGRRTEWNRLRQEYPAWRPMLPEVSLSQASLSEFDLSFVDFTAASFEDCDLSGANLRGTTFEYASFKSTKFSDASCADACFDSATLHDCTLLTATGKEGTNGPPSFRNTRFESSTIQGSLFENAIMLGVSFIGGQLSASLKHAELIAASFRHVGMDSSSFEDANLQGAVFLACSMQSVRLNGADATNATFYECDINDISLYRARLVGAHDLFGPHRAIARLGNVPDEYTAQSVVFASTKDRVPWTWLRVIGALRLFGVSYAALVAIVIYAKLAQWFNIGIASDLRTEAQQKIESGVDWPWRTSISQLPDLPVPGNFGVQIVMIGLLALGATVYQLRCPDLVKENTETKWTRELNEPLHEYRSAMWSRIRARYLCAVAFGIGGTYTVCYLLFNTVRALRYILFG